MSLSEVVRDWLLQPVVDRLTALENRMADISADLNELATTVGGPLQTSVRDVLAELDTLRAEKAAREGEEVRESEAAGNLRKAVNELAATITRIPDAPDVEPIA